MDQGHKIDDLGKKTGNKGEKVSLALSKGKILPTSPSTLTK